MSLFAKSFEKLFRCVNEFDHAPKLELEPKTAAAKISWLFCEAATPPVERACSLWPEPEFELSSAETPLYSYIWIPTVSPALSVTVTL